MSQGQLSDSRAHKPASEPSSPTPERRNVVINEILIFFFFNQYELYLRKHGLQNKRPVPKSSQALLCLFQEEAEHTDPLIFQC